MRSLLVFSLAVLLLLGLAHSKRVLLWPWGVPSTVGLDRFGPLIVCPGDALQFKWEGGDPDGQHGVVRLRSGASNCDLSGSSQLAAPSDGGYLETYIQANRGDTLWYADPVGDHCSRGAVVEVFVSDRSDVVC